MDEVVVSKKILIVSRMLPEPNTNISASLIIDFIKFLQNEGFYIKYFYTAAATDKNLKEKSVLIDLVSARDFKSESTFPSLIASARTALANIVRPIAWDALATREEVNLCERVIDEFKPDVVIADRCWMAGVFDLMNCQDPVQKILFLHDLRIRHVPCMNDIGIKNHEFWDDKKEGALLRKADAILVLNEEDERLCREMAPLAAVIKVGLSGDLIHFDSKDQVEGRLIYVGSAVPENKVSLVDFFLTKAWPLIRGEVPYATLTVCGSAGTFLRAPPDGVIVTGRVDNLEPYYAAAQAAIVPHALSGGMKLKFADALARGRAIVANTNGIAGFPESAGHCALIGDDPASFAAMVIRVLTDRTLRERMETAAKELALVRLSPGASYGLVSAFIRQPDEAR